MKTLDELRPAAKAAFENCLREKVDWVSTKCWKSNLEAHVKELNEILKAGIEFGVGVGPNSMLQENEIRDLTRNLGPLKVLGMVDEMREELICVLNDHGVDPNILN